MSEKQIKFALDFIPLVSRMTRIVYIACVCKGRHEINTAYECTLVVVTLHPKEYASPLPFSSLDNGSKP